MVAKLLGLKTAPAPADAADGVAAALAFLLIDQHIPSGRNARMAAARTAAS
jgi:Holliday junction resolvasome RuvABC endonuclease subunit